MPRGKCPKCGYTCAGWALRNPEQQTCPKCGTKLEITEGDFIADDKKKDSREKS